MKKVFLFLTFFTLVLPVWCQDWNAVFTHEIDAEYFIAEGDFDRAAESYLKALEIAPNSANLKYKAGFCFLKTDTHKGRAMAYLNEASQNVSKDFDSRSFREIKAPPEALYHLGVAYMHEKLFDLAIDCFNRYKEFYDSKDKYVVALVEQRIKNCNKAKAVFLLDPDYIIDYNSVSVNDDNSNFNAVISGDGNTLAFTSRTELGNAIFVSKLVEGIWAEPAEITRRLGSKLLRTCFLSYDGTELFLVEEDFNGSRLCSSKLVKDKWSKVDDLPKPIASKYSEGHICSTKDGQTVYFTSDRNGSLGGFDIYKSVKTNDKWGKAENLGSTINTELDEKTPFLTADDRYLFFSSEGHDGIGGQDVYYTDLQDPTQQVISLGVPLNTPDDDMFFTPKTLSQGYYSAFRGGTGLVDIYAVEFRPLYNMRVNVRVANPDFNSLSYSVAITDKTDNSLLNSTQAAGSRDIVLRLPAGNYGITATGAEVEEVITSLEIPKNTDKTEFSKSLLINKVLEVAQPIAQTVTPADPEPQQPLPAVQPKPEVINTVQHEEPKVEEPKTETRVVEKPKVEEPKTETREVEKPKVEEVDNSTPKVTPKKSTPKPKPRAVTTFDVSLDELPSQQMTYSVQLFASEQPADIQHISCFDSVDVTVSSRGYYRYSIGKTTDVQEVESWLKSIKAKGFNNAYVRINREAPGFTIQIMALSKPRSLSYFENLSGVMVSRSVRGVYRYCVGKYATKEEAQNEVESLVEMGYSGAFVREL